MPENSAIPNTARQWILAEYPRKQLDISRNFRLIEKPINFDGHQDKARNKILVKCLWFSNDPAQRTWMTDKPEERMYIKPIREGDVIIAGTVGEVVESFHPDYKKGDLVRGYFGWTEYIVIDLDDKATSSIGLVKVPPKINPAEYIATGLTALTAYFGLLKIGAPTPKDRTIVVSGAAGATGSIVTQIAKNILGIERVIGIAGSDEKCALIKEKCGVDIALNYKSPDFKAEYEKATPDYVDIYFDNVGGEILDMNLLKLAKFGRVVTCGSLSSYDDDLGEKKMAISAKAYENLIFMRGRIQGFIIIDYADDFEEALGVIRKWIQQGRLHVLKTVWKAKFEDIPYGMTKLVQGDNTGKLVTELVES